MKSPLTSACTARPGASFQPGSTFREAYRIKFGPPPRGYADIAGSGQCQFLVLAAEVFGRFDGPSKMLVSSLARNHAQSVPPILRRRMELLWYRRWWGFLSVAVQIAVADSLLPAVEQPTEADSPALFLRRHSATDHTYVLELDQEAPDISRLPGR